MRAKCRSTIPAALALVLATAAPAVAGDAGRGTRIDVEAAQAILAVQRLDGWLLCQHEDSNPIAEALVVPPAGLTRRWCYLIPAEGQPIALVHKSEAKLFESIPGRKVEYRGHRDLKAGLRTMLKGAERIAMEYAPESGIPELTRVDAATIKLVKGRGVKVVSSAKLVQFTKALWGPDGRLAHYVAVHHLTKIRQEVLAWLARKLRGGAAVSEYQLQQQILDRMKVRALVSNRPPSVASGPNTAEPSYQPSAARSRLIEEGDLVVLDLAGALEGAKRPIYANLSWVAFVGSDVPERYADVFAAVVRARDEAIHFIRERVERRRPVKGFEADQKARAVLGDAGFADRFVHRTGHSLDTDLDGAGADLDSYETHDTRALVQDSGFTVGPGVYVSGDFGVRSEVDLYLGRGGLEVTSPMQEAITPILGGKTAAR